VDADLAVCVTRMFVLVADRRVLVAKMVGPVCPRRMTRRWIPWISAAEQETGGARHCPVEAGGPEPILLDQALPPVVEAEVDVV